MSTRLPAIAPMMISSRATDTAIQACSEAAVSARPIHSADANQMLSIPNLSSAGSGGGEFRLPLRMHGIGFDAKSAVPLNLMISLVTLSFAMISRSGVVSLAAIVPHLPEVAGLATGGMASAVYGVRLVRKLSGVRLVQLVGLLLIGIGTLLLGEAAFPVQYASPLPASVTAHLLSGVIIGAGIGLVSSVLGVAGGELLIPSLISIYGADIRTAGSASILISLGIVLTGLWRYWRSNSIP